MHGVVAKVQMAKKKKGVVVVLVLVLVVEQQRERGVSTIGSAYSVGPSSLLEKIWGCACVCPVFDPIASFVHRIQSSIVTAGAVVVVAAVVTKGDKWSWSRALPSPHTWCPSPTARSLALVVGGCSIRSVRWEHATEAR